MKNTNKDKEFISLAEASVVCRLSHDHLRRLAEQGKLKAQKIGRNWVTTRQAVEEYLKTRRTPGRPKKKKGLV